MNPHYPGVAERAEHRCEYCLSPEDICEWKPAVIIAAATPIHKLLLSARSRPQLHSTAIY